MAKMDFLRQLDLLDASKFNHPIHIIGVGATGSYIALAVAKITASSSITVWDFDKVEDHNLPNQLYGPDDVGKLKTEALSEHIFRQTGVLINQMRIRCEPTSDLSGIVFLCVDSMKARKEIWDGAIKFNPKIVLMVEMRLGIEIGQIYTVNPSDPADVEGWESNWYPDDKAQESPCTNRMIGTTVMVMAGICAHRIIHHFNKRDIPKKALVSLESDLIQLTEEWSGERAEVETLVSV